MFKVQFNEAQKNIDKTAKQLVHLEKHGRFREGPLLGDNDPLPLKPNVKPLINNPPPPLKPNVKPVINNPPPLILPNKPITINHVDNVIPKINKKPNDISSIFLVLIGIAGLSIVV